MNAVTYIALSRTAERVWEIVWRFRRETKDAYPIPDRLWSARFAASESGETLDAVIRAEPQFKRNNAKQVSRERELADTAFMLATTVGETIPMSLFDKAAVALGVLGLPSDIDVIPLLVGRALWAVKSGQTNWQLEAAVALLVVVDVMDNPVGSVDETLARLKTKWGGETAADSSPLILPTTAEQSEVKIVPPGVDDALDITPQAIAQFEYMVRCQREKGIAKYGAPLTDKTEFPAFAFIWQEFADLGVYLTRLQLDVDKLNCERDAAIDASGNASVAAFKAEKAAEMWQSRWADLYWRMVPGGKDQTLGTFESMREAQVYQMLLRSDIEQAKRAALFVPLDVYAADGYVPADGEIGYHGQLNVWIVYRP